ncbi:MAG: hypothetical protein PHP57_13900 [Sideroxydans sp.]|nr:hypothetical protein [Sideroxydans sp.]
MSIELTDLRAKIDELTDEWLHAKEQELGKDRSEIVRMVLHELASRDVRNATLLCNRLIAKGLIKDDKGLVGKV